MTDETMLEPAIDVISLIPHTPASPAHRALATAIFMPRDAWPAETARDLAPILSSRI